MEKNPGMFSSNVIFLQLKKKDMNMDNAGASKLLGKFHSGSELNLKYNIGCSFVGYFYI